jgi:aryl-alcohol dehydrogenase-like predicted oxidoreductase
MKYYQYSGRKVSACCLGGAQFGSKYGITADHELGAQESQEIIEAALESGVNFFDTAADYGKSESLLLKALGNKRKDALVATKISSLEQYKEGFDIVYVHRPQIFFDNPKAFSFIPNLGMSVYEPWEAERALEYDEIGVFQVPYNAFHRKFDEVIEKMKERGKLVVTRSTFVQGLVFVEPDNLPDYFNPIKSELNTFYKEIGEPREAFFLNYVLQKDIGPVIVGVHSADQLKKDLAIFDAPRAIDISIPNIDTQYIDPRAWPK